AGSELSTLKVIVHFIRAEHGLSISYQKAWYACEAALDDIRGSPEESYKILPRFAYILELNNSGYVVEYKGNPVNNMKYQVIDGTSQYVIYLPTKDKILVKLFVENKGHWDVQLMHHHHHLHQREKKTLGSCPRRPPPVAAAALRHTPPSAFAVDNPEPISSSQAHLPSCQSTVSANCRHEASRSVSHTIARRVLIVEARKAQPSRAATRPKRVERSTLTCKSRRSAPTRQPRRSMPRPANCVAPRGAPRLCAAPRSRTRSNPPAAPAHDSSTKSPESNFIVYGDLNILEASIQGIIGSYEPLFFNLILQFTKSICT
uniref:Uncharacterized protein n=1 Tax=Cucumis melo TaxID=3656 RepID=A0A9I9EIR9_CUCME